MIYQQKKSTGGYTMVELIITLSILALITGLVSVGRQPYRDTILFTNMVYDVAQTIREMQVLAASGRETPGSSLTYSAGYGLFFFPLVAKDKEFRIYADYGPSSNPRDWRFNDTSTEDDLIGVYTLGGGAKIKSICRVLSSNGSCSSNGSTSITFKGPDLGACINDGDAIDGQTYPSVSTCTSQSGYSSVRIVLESPNGRTMTIEVYASGQISVD